jgi:hypothetical protein
MPTRAGPLAMAGGATATWRRSTSPTRTPLRKIPRNSPCPCGSGRKFKQCHGAAGVSGRGVRSSFPFFSCHPGLDPGSIVSA